MYLEFRPMPTDVQTPPNKSSTDTGPPADDATRMSFGDHLEDLRRSLTLALLGVVVASVLSLVYGREILLLICRPLLIVQYANGLQPSLQALSPTAAFSAYLKIAFLSGLIVAMPWVLYQFWRFVALGLYAHERRFVRRLLPASLGLFVVGVLFLYFVVLPIVLHFFIGFNKAFNLPDLTPTAFQTLLLGSSESNETTAETFEPPARIPMVSAPPEQPAPGDMWFDRQTRRLNLKTSDGIWSMPLERGESSSTMHSQFAIDFYVSFVLMLALAFGIAFETPVVVFFLVWSRIVSRTAMLKGRRYVLLGTVVFSAILTPPDVISQVLLAFPMYLLFELGLLVSRLVEQKDADRATA